LTQLHSGSWINQDFKIWIGHVEDNRGWDLLQHTRSRLMEITPTLSKEQAEGAWDELYAAQGSDWFWWYGDDFDTDYKPEFDRLFRTHLRNVWTRAGLTPPEHLNQSLIESRTSQQADMVQFPVALLSPQIDGAETSFFEWRGAGSINPNPPLGAMWKAEGLFAAIYFGSNREAFFLRLDPDPRIASRSAHLRGELHVTVDEHLYQLSFALNPSRPAEVTASRVSRSGERQPASFSGSLARGAIIELALPYQDLEMDTGQDMRFSIAVSEESLEIARYPHSHPVMLARPGDDFEATMWRV
jgi:hypothetical protein